MVIVNDPNNLTPYEKWRLEIDRSLIENVDSFPYNISKICGRKVDDPAAYWGKVDGFVENIGQDELSRLIFKHVGFNDKERVYFISALHCRDEHKKLKEVERCFKYINWMYEWVKKEKRFFTLNDMVEGLKITYRGAQKLVEEFEDVLKVRKIKNQNRYMLWPLKEDAKDE